MVSEGDSLFTDQGSAFRHGHAGKSRGSILERLSTPKWPLARIIDTAQAAATRPRSILLNLQTSSAGFSMHYYAVDLESFVFSGAPLYARLSAPERKRLDEGTIVRHVESLLQLLNACRVKLTFFIVGEIYDWYPDLIAEIDRQGHEVAWHTHSHIYLRRPGLLPDELRASRRFIEKFAIRGFQAPAIIFHRQDYRELAAWGFKYSASVYGPQAPYMMDGILEVPVSARPWRTPESAPSRSQAPDYPARMTFRRLLGELPFGSSLFLKLLGWRRISRYILDCERLGLGANLFIHNWQLYDEPRRARRDRFRESIVNPLSIPYAWKVQNDFRRLLQTHAFGRLDTAVAEA